MKNNPKYIKNKERNNQNDDKKKEKEEFKKILKDVELFGASHMTWKERKELENQKVVSLGGKPPKKQRLPLSVARVQMKKQKERELKLQQENLILGQFGHKSGGGARSLEQKQRPQIGVLKSSEGHFRDGVLNVKHLLSPDPSRESDSRSRMAHGGKKGTGKNKGNKKKGGRGKRH